MEGEAAISCDRKGRAQRKTGKRKTLEESQILKLTND